MAVGGSFRRGPLALSPRTIRSTTNSLGRCLRREAHIPRLFVDQGVVSPATSRSGARSQRFHRASVWRRSRFSARGPRLPARPRGAWERGNVRDLKIGPVIHPTSTQQRPKASPGRHSLVILGTGRRRPGDHTLDAPVFLCYPYYTPPCGFRQSSCPV